MNTINSLQKGILTIRQFRRKHLEGTQRQCLHLKPEDNNTADVLITLAMCCYDEHRSCN